MEVTRLLVNEMRDVPTVGTRDVARAGADAEQFHIEIDFKLDEWPIHDIDHAVKMYLKPAAAAFAERLKAECRTSFAQLELPKQEFEAARAFDPRSGISIRGVVAYQPPQAFELSDGTWYEREERIALRFDVITLNT